MMRSPITITGQPTVPGASQYTVLLDSTRKLIVAAPSPAASIFAPGSYRHAWRGGRVRGDVKVGNQAITLAYYILTDPTLTTSSAWELDTTITGGTGTQAVTASTTKIVNWLPPAADFCLLALAGGTPPNTLNTSLSIVFHDLGSGQ